MLRSTWYDLGCQYEYTILILKQVAFNNKVKQSCAQLFSGVLKFLALFSDFTLIAWNLMGVFVLLSLEHLAKSGCSDFLLGESQWLNISNTPVTI